MPALEIRAPEVNLKSLLLELSHHENGVLWIRRVPVRFATEMGENWTAAFALDVLLHHPARKVPT